MIRSISSCSSIQLHIILLIDLSGSIPWLGNLGWTSFGAHSETTSAWFGKTQINSTTLSKITWWRNYSNNGWKLLMHRWVGEFCNASINSRERVCRAWSIVKSNQLFWPASWTFQYFIISWVLHVNSNKIQAINKASWKRVCLYSPLYEPQMKSPRSNVRRIFLLTTFK